MSTQVAQKKKQEVGGVIDYGDYAGAGFENQTSADVSIPFIGLLQGLSPQLNTLDGAKAGMLINTVTEELFDGKEGLEFIPAYTEHVFVEWIPRANGGGFVAVHATDSDVVKQAKEESGKFGEYKVGDNDLVETFYVYVVLVNNDEMVGMAVLAFSSTKIKVYKHWNTKIRMFTVVGAGNRKVRPPLFAHRVRLTSFLDKNNKGEFHNFKLTPAKGDLRSSLLEPGSELMEAAVNCKDMVLSGVARAAYESQDASEGEGDIPF